jgi:hypothetical protein
MVWQHEIPHHRSMRRHLSQSRSAMTTIEWITLLLVVLFCAFALIPEVRDWVLEHIQEFSAAFR